ncbi:hypothetical protein EV359DRAFT_87810 [Lentinula novae-zelandiae]|nr:hypothetical protein EV359DRAFT_87810 [Lentinula novae-zelandiae]
MPTISTCQCILRGAFKYVQKLQGWSSKCHEESELLDELDYTVDNDEFGVTTDDTSSLSTLSLFSSSLLSLLSLSSMEDRGPNTMTEFSEEEEKREDQNYMMRYRASCAQIAEILSTRVLFPNRVHKLSQLFLVLELYKKDDVTITSFHHIFFLILSYLLHPLSYILPYLVT